MIGNGKHAEDVKVQRLFASERIDIRTAATTFYNGVSATTTAGTGIDTKGYDDLHLALNTGTILGAVATLVNDIMEADEDNPMNAVAVTGTAFTSRKTTSDEALSEASINLKDRKRYLFLRTQFQGAPATFDFGAVGILSKAQSKPVSKTLEFDI